ncbi:hypothetical protein DTO166G4_4615 [Paecilomyces variotii]|uniref:Acyltransferase 3 n=1 Tax=Byssochlamys spectabilis TaxID=264951 RepID=A0A443I0Q0_BYSSP|nr:acyltransferase 3 [Paecilomyces variotii]KAJ9196538.1 hypothetical protein DTO032I3_6310 [Paecilomyces variotii]KAJ9201963.1 hypothetical protein DTO164E3_3401 [Paecilomyces variotii]KAJ9213836.1 hypothetical protein DTO166G4_4615 [Paecilomyces variotii]KAJ9225142.1 hypothetical protein DTO169C6_2483 [Paecilomyces variotii]KAJ9229280.1 hypothetical protein DTO169E5_8938 [Paecilomyces variotii]
MSYNPSYIYERLRETIPAALPWSGGDPSVKGDPKKTVKWVDGLRGIASFMVVLTHLARAWDYDLFSPRDTPDAAPRLLQWPVFRIPWQGRIGVTIFAFLTGYVCALKPLKLSRAGNTQSAFTTIAKSAFRRPPRLIFPATIAMVISWVIAQCGGFTVANRSDCWWCRYAAPDLEDSFYKEVIRLFKNFLSTWTTGYMAYDDHQWALLPLLKASMLVYILLFATMYLKFRYRFMVYVGMLLYFHQDAGKDVETFQTQAVYGMLLCDLSYDLNFKEFVDTHSWLRKIVAASVCAFGLFVAGYPGEHPEWSGWSNAMLWLSNYIFPPEVNIGKRYTAIAADCIIFAIFISPGVKEFLSSRLLLWLGKQSFAVYLVHGTLLRVPLVWMLYGITGQPWEETVDADGNVIPPPWLHIRPPWVVAISIPCWIVLVYICASLWTNYVDPFCARMTQKLENLMFEEDEKPHPPMPLTSLPMPTA